MSWIKIRNFLNFQKRGNKFAWKKIKKNYLKQFCKKINKKYVNIFHVLKNVQVRF